jgi:RNA polymerase sigma factor (TIGR02999 family)
MTGEKNGHTLQTTALIHEAYLRLEKLNKIKWQDRSHFLAISARLMRRILVEAARSRKTEKRGGERQRVSFSEDIVVMPGWRIDMIDLDWALEKLAKIDERKSRVIELRFFAGLKVEETAELLEISVPTVIRDWNFSKAWILNEIRNR